MATIRKRTSNKTGKVSWQIDYFDPTGKRVRQSFKKKKEAEAELGKRVSLIAENRYGIKTPDGVTFHTTRHTFGSWLAIKGVPIKTIQELMGHRDIKMTMRYAHLAENVKIEAVNVLNGLTDKKNRTCHAGVTRTDIDDSSKKQKAEITAYI